MRDAAQKKATTYNREPDHHGATLVPFIITTVGLAAPTLMSVVNSAPRML